MLAAIKRFPRAETWWVSPAGRRWTRALLIAIILLGTTLRLYHLDYNSLWVDEIVTATLTQMPLPTMSRVISSYDNHPPLFYMITSLSKVIGDSDFATRLPAALAGIISIPLLFALARRLQAGTFAALVASLLLAIWPYHLQYSQEARSYTLPILLQMLSMYWLYRGLVAGQARAWLWYLFTTIASLYAHYFAFLWLAAQGIFVLVFGISALFRSGRSPHIARLGRTVLPFGAVLLVCALAYLPWYKILLIHTQLLVNVGRLPAYNPNLSTVYFQVLLPIWRAFTGYHPAFAAALAIAVIAGIVLSLVRRKWAVMVYIFLNLSIVVVALGFASSAPYFHPKYGFPLLAPVLLLAAQGIGLLYYTGGVLSHGAVAVSRKVPSLAVGLVLLLVVAALMMPFAWAYYRVQKEDWRNAASYVATHKTPQDVIIADGVFGGGGGGDALRVKQGLGYYLHDPAAIIKAETGLVDRLPASREARGTAWGVIWYQGKLKDRAPLAEMLDFADFYSVVVFRLKRPSGLVWHDTTTILEAMLKLQPMPETHLDLHLALAQLYVETGDFDLAVRHIDAVLAVVSPDDGRVKTALAKANRVLLLTKARQAQKAGNLKLARALFAQALATEQDPGFRFDILMEWAIFERFHANPVEAIGLLEQALALRPDNTETRANYGAVLLDAGRLEEAIRELTAVITKSPDHFWANYLAGIAYYRSARLPEALASWQQAAKVAVNDAHQGMAIQRAVEAAMQIKDCATLRDIAQKYASALASQEKAVGQFLVSCP